MNTAQVSPSTAVNDWDDEKFYYNYGANTCSFVCGHYTQVVWAETEYVGCAVASCSPLVLPGGTTWSSGYYYVCNYGESGNFNGARPYVSGATCSQCPSGYTCNNNLCQ
nr:GLIPR1-like protein 1 [Crassostrea gigas]